MSALVNPITQKNIVRARQIVSSHPCNTLFVSITPVLLSEASVSKPSYQIPVLLSWCILTEACLKDRPRMCRGGPHDFANPAEVATGPTLEVGTKRICEMFLS